MSETANHLIQLRLLVGYMGEKSQHNWWPCDFFSPHSQTFLEPIFPRTVDLARYNGIKEAACAAHDAHIGVGKVFHLFRLPENTEFRLHEAAGNKAIMAKLLEDIANAEAAMNALGQIAIGQDKQRSGPVRIGDRTALDGDRWVAQAAAYYLTAFRAGERCFPYITTDP